jgi:short-subunit dehydrogenase
MAGGSQGIGAGVAICFAQSGANIIVIGRSQERLEMCCTENHIPKGGLVISIDVALIDEDSRV